MEFNLDKHVTLHLGSCSQARAYKVNRKILSGVEDQRDFAVYAHRSLNVEGSSVKWLKRYVRSYALLTDMGYKSRELILELHWPIV